MSEAIIGSVGHFVISSAPKAFFGSASFVSAFQLKYVSEDTDRFISTFVERIRQHLFINVAIFLLLLALFSSKGTPLASGASLGATAIKADFDQTARILLAAASAAINVIFLSRPYFMYLERNKTHLQN